MSGGPEWIPDDSVSACMGCSAKFTFMFRKHHCRVCGGIFCWKCSDYKLTLRASDGPVRACSSCYNKATRKQSETAAPKIVQPPVILQADRVLYETRSLCTYCAVFERNGYHFSRNVSYVIQLNGEIYLYTQCPFHPEPSVTLICGDANFFHRMNLFTWDNKFGSTVPHQLLAVAAPNGDQGKISGDVYTAIMQRPKIDPASRPLVGAFMPIHLLHRIRAPICSYVQLPKVTPSRLMGYAGLPLVVEIDVCTNGVFVREDALREQIDAIQLYYPPEISFFLRLRALGIPPNKMHIFSAYTLFIDCLINFPSVQTSLCKLIKSTNEVLAAVVSGATATGGSSGTGSAQTTAAATTPGHKTFSDLALRIRTEANRASPRRGAPRAHILVASTIERIAHLALVPRPISCLRSSRVLPELLCHITDKEAPKLAESLNEALLAIKLAFPTTQCILSLTVDSTCVLKAAEMITSASSSPSVAVAAGAGVGMSATPAAEPQMAVASPTPMAAALEAILGVALARTDLVRAVMVSQVRAMNNTVGRFAMRAALRTVDSFHSAPILKGDSHIVAMRRVQAGLTVDIADGASVRLSSPVSTTTGGPGVSPPTSPSGSNGSPPQVTPTADGGAGVGLDALRSPESVSALLNAAKARILDQRLAQTAYANANSGATESKEKKDVAPSFQLIPESIDPMPLLAVLRATTKGAVTARDFIPLAALRAFAPLFEAAGVGALPLSSDPNGAFVAVLGHRASLQGDGTSTSTGSGSADPESTAVSIAGSDTSKTGSLAQQSGVSSESKSAASKETPSRFKAALSAGCHALPDAFGTLPATFSHISGVPPQYNAPNQADGTSSTGPGPKSGGVGAPGHSGAAASARSPEVQSATVNSVMSLARLLNIRALCDTFLPLAAEIEAKKAETDDASKQENKSYCDQLRAALHSFALGSPVATAALAQLAKLIPSGTEGLVPASPTVSEAATPTPAPRASQGTRGLQLLLVLNEGDFASVDMLRRARPFAVRAATLDNPVSAAAASRVQFVSTAASFV